MATTTAGWSTDVAEVQDDDILIRAHLPTTVVARAHPDSHPWGPPGLGVRRFGQLNHFRAMDLVAGTPRAIVVTVHVTKYGTPKIVYTSDLPLSGAGAPFDVDPEIDGSRDAGTRHQVLGAEA